MADITITEATIDGARLAVVNNGSRDNNAPTLLSSYVNTDRLVPVTLDYSPKAVVGGVPLSVSLYVDPDINPSVSAPKGMFYALDIIDNTFIEDENLNPKMGNIPTSPTDRTFTWNGNRLAASKISDRYYMNMVNDNTDGNATSITTIMGLPMAQGTQNELIVNKTSYAMTDIDELITMYIGGSPLTAGRIGNNYYLIINVFSYSSQFYNFINRLWEVGRISVERVGKTGELLEGPTSTFQNDDASPYGILLDAAGDEVWIDDNVTGTRLLGGGVDSGFKIQKIEYNPGVLYRVWGENCTYFRCNGSPTDIAGILDVSALTALTILQCNTNSISVLDVTALTVLTNLRCYTNSISVLDVTALTVLTTLQCYVNSISVLDVTALTVLTTLLCNTNSISVLDVSALTVLTYLSCHTNSISVLDVSALTVLTDLYCGENSMTTEAVDTIIDDLYDTWTSDVNPSVEGNPRTGILNIGGTNASPTGTYQDPGGPPTSPKEKLWLLANDGVNPWTVTYTA